MDDDAHTPVGRILLVAQRLLGADVALASWTVDGQPMIEARGLDNPNEADLFALAKALLAGGSSIAIVDASKYRGIRQNPLIRRRSGLRGIGSSPLLDRTGNPVGALCVASAHPQAFDLAALADLALILGDIVAVEPANNSDVPEPASTVLLDALSNGVIVLNESGEIVRHNLAAAEFLAQSADAELTGQNVVQFVKPSEMPGLESQFEQVLDARSATRIITLLRSDGTPLVVEMSASAYMEGGETRFVGVFHEPSRHASDDALELLSASPRLERALVKQSEFMRKISHEFRSAVTVITVFSELIRDTDLRNDQIRDYAHDIHTDAHRLARLCDDILIIEQSMEPMMNLQVHPTNIVELISSLVARHQVIDPNHEFTFTDRMIGTTVDVDADRIVQAVTNLLDNAAKYADEGTIISTSVEIIGGELHISVADRGMGIAPKDLTRIFEREFRSENARRLGIAGAGLGLAVTRKIAELHSGSVEVQTKVGRGSTFTLIIPLAVPTL